MKLTFPNGEHGEVALKGGTTNLGSSPGNEVLLNQEGISEVHARIVQEAGSVEVLAVGDSDVYLNGRRVSDRAPLRPGDMLGLHKVQVRIGAGSEDAAPAAPAAEEEPVDATRIRPVVINYQLRGVSGDTFGKVFPLSSQTDIGREAGCAIVLNADEVSRRHALIEISPGRITVTDLNSANGTFVNGNRLRADKRHELKGNDEIAFDKLRFRVESTVERKKAGPRPPASPAAPAPTTATAKSSSGAVWIVVGLVIVAAVAVAAAWAMGLF